MVDFLKKKSYNGEYINGVIDKYETKVMILDMVMESNGLYVIVNPQPYFQIQVEYDY